MAPTTFHPCPIFLYIYALTEFSGSPSCPASCWPAPQRLQDLHLPSIKTNERAQSQQLKHQRFSGWVELTCLKKGPGATPYGMWQTWQAGHGSSLLKIWYLLSKIGIDSESNLPSNVTAGRLKTEGRQIENHNHRKLTNLITWTTALSNSVKLWAMPCRVTQDRWVTVESYDRMWSTGEGNGNPLQYSCLENPMNSMKRQKDRTLKDELPKVGRCQICYWRSVEK